MLLWPRKNCKSLSSRSALLHRIFLEKMLVIFLMATMLPSLEVPSSYLAEHTMPYAPWPNSLTILNRLSMTKSWLNTLLTVRPLKVMAKYASEEDGGREELKEV